MRRKFNIFYRVIINGIQNFWRNAWLSFTGVIVITIAIVMIIGGVITNITASNVTTDISQDFKINIDLKDEVDLGRVQALQEHLKDHPNVKDVVYVTSATHRQRFEKRFEDEAAVISSLDIVGGEIFNPSIEFNMLDLNDLQTVKEIPNQSQYQDIVLGVDLDDNESAQKTLTKATNVQNVMTGISVILVIVFAGIACLVIFNTVRMAIFARREEIQIMRLLGASAFYIRTPFLVEAIVGGVLAGVFATSVVYGLIIGFGDRLQAIPELVDSYDYFVDPYIGFLIIGGALISGALVALMSAVLAIQRHLILKI